MTVARTRHRYRLLDLTGEAVIMSLTVIEGPSDGSSHSTCFSLARLEDIKRLNNFYIESRTTPPARHFLPAEMLPAKSRILYIPQTRLPL